MTNTQDEFAQSSSGYSTEKFYTASTDGNGGGALMHVKVPNSAAGEAAALVAMRVFPDYRTPHDIMRDAFVHRMHTLSTMTKDPAAMARIQSVQDHLIVVNALTDIERMNAIESELQRLSYSVNTNLLGGNKRQVANAKIEAAITLLEDRSDLQAILRSKLDG